MMKWGISDNDDKNPEEASLSSEHLCRRAAKNVDGETNGGPLSHKKKGRIEITPGATRPLARRAASIITKRGALG